MLPSIANYTNIQGKHKNCVRLEGQNGFIFQQAAMMSVFMHDGVPMTVMHALKHSVMVVNVAQTNVGMALHVNRTLHSIKKGLEQFKEKTVIVDIGLQ